jgi:hypothetical protein
MFLFRAPTEKAKTYWDKNLAAFGLRVSPKGRKTWIAQYRVRGGPEVVETLGTTAIIPNVGDARLGASKPVVSKTRHQPGYPTQAEEGRSRRESQCSDFCRANGTLHDRSMRKPISRRVALLRLVGC